MENKEERGTKRKAEEEEDPSSIILNVKSQWDNCEIFFKVRGNTRLYKVIHAYAKKKGIDYKHYHFVYNGNRLNAKKTPNSLHMEAEDEILAILPAGGGGCKGFAAIKPLKYEI
ncbi:hypothetical protein UlMin_017673 [Ulmus minor]